LGSIDLEFSAFVDDMTPEDMDDEIMSITNNYAIVSASGSVDASGGDAMIADCDSSCETIVHCRTPSHLS